MNLARGSTDHHDPEYRFAGGPMESMVYAHLLPAVLLASTCVVLEIGTMVSRWKLFEVQAYHVLSPVNKNSYGYAKRGLQCGSRQVSASRNCIGIC